MIVRRYIDQALNQAKNFYFGFASNSFELASDLSSNEKEKETLKMLADSCFMTQKNPGELIRKN